MNHTLRIAMDIDGTVCTKGSHDIQYQDAVVDENMLGLVNYLFDKGIQIFFYTSRGSIDYDVTKRFLDESGFKYTALIPDKLMYDIIIDDKALDWSEGFSETNVQALVNRIDKLERE